MRTEVTFLFGAGASLALGSHVQPSAPPLMRGLYDELAKFYPNEWGVGSRLENHADQFRKDFENTFTEVVLGITKDYALPGPSLSLLEGQKPLAMYFSRFTLDFLQTDCYSILLRAIGQSGRMASTVFGSLNYDCLLEQAAKRLGLFIDYECGSGESGKFRLTKFHGSCNFIARMDQTTKAMLAGTGVNVEVPVR